MRFVNPQFLYALVTVSIPVIIHLFNLHKHRTVVFSNVTFLNEVKKSTRAKTTVKEWLILLSRMLAITALVLAFAQPYIASNTAISDSDAHSVYIDNSYSSLNQLNGTPVLQYHTSKALAVLKAIPAHQTTQVLTNNFTLQQQHLLRPDQHINMLPKIEESGNAKNLKQVTNRQKQAFKNQQLHSYIISDFQKSQFSNIAKNIDSSIRYYFIPNSNSNKSNISIDSVWFDSPIKSVNTSQELHFKITNHGPKEVNNQMVNLKLNNNDNLSIRLTLFPGQVLDTMLIYSNPDTGWVKGSIFTEDNNYSYDNQLFFSYQVLPQLKVLEIHDKKKQPIYAKAFALEPYFDFKSINISQLKRNQIQQSQLVILNLFTPPSSAVVNWLANFIKNGGSVSINPLATKENKTYAPLLSSLQIPPYGTYIKDSLAIVDINEQSVIYQGVFADEQPTTINYAKVYAYFYKKQLPSSSTQLLSTNNIPLLIDHKIEKGHLYQFNFGISDAQSNFKNHSLLLPTFYQFAFTSNQPKALYQFVNSSFIRTEPSANTTLVEIKNEDQTFAFAPQVVPVQNELKLFLHNQVLKEGHYAIYQNNEIMAWTSFNYPRTESQPDYFSAIALKNLKDSLNWRNVSVITENFEQLALKINQAQKGVGLWQYFLGLALLFLIIEIVLIRYFKPLVI